MIDDLRGLYGVADSGVRPELPLIEKVRALLQGGARVVQLRQKREGAREALAVARLAVPLCHARGARCVVNDRLDVALLAHADGVHLGDSDLPVDRARALAPGLLIGATVRDLAGAQAAGRAGASYVGLGPIFGTRTKRVNVPPRGLEMLAEVVRGAALPVVAIGGIDLARIGDVARAGAAMAAVVSAPFDGGDPAEATRALALAFSRGAAA